LVALLPTLAAAQWKPPPAPTTFVTDRAGLLSPSTRQSLDAQLQRYEDQTGHQVIVWIGASTEGVPLEEWAARTFEAWRVGRKGIDDGLSLFIFANDRKMRIEVGYGLEERVPDAVASRVIHEVLVPGFRASDYDAAVQRAVNGLLGAIEGRVVVPGAKPTARAPPVPVGPGQLVMFGLAALAFLFLLITRPSLALTLLWMMSGRGGFGGGGGGRRGGFSGGGGRSGGGGASGSW
jgi:uncharacterized protein